MAIKRSLRVKEILKEKKMTAKELASILGMTETGLGLAIREGGNPSLQRMQQIAEILDVNTEDLFVSPHRELSALVEYDGKFYKATTLNELKEVVKNIEAMTGKETD